jgi:hypothetical protein
MKDAIISATESAKVAQFMTALLGSLEMRRVRSEYEKAAIKRWVEAEQTALYPDDNIQVSVNKFSPPENGADVVITRYPKSWSVD